ncbi:MAG: peroxidase-related enzyme [Pelistega sp.]|nr:peroxidase-related enzyme [Pelistega sp.]
MSNHDSTDLIDALLRLEPSSTTYQARHFRDKVVRGTQDSYEAIFSDKVNLNLAWRYFVAVYACHLSKATELEQHYVTQAKAQGISDAWLSAVQQGQLETIDNAQLKAILDFTAKLIVKPVEGDQDAILSLKEAGISTPDIVALGQLIAFLSYQVRLFAGLKAIQALEQGDVEGISVSEAIESQASAEAKPLIDAAIKIKGFTNETLGWKAWLDVVDVERATAAQIEVLEASHPQAKTSDYYLLLVHEPEILNHRSTTYNAIMYAPGGLNRADRELGALTVSRINGCVYCASVHAQRFEQLAKRNQIVADVFTDPASAGDNARDKAIIELATKLTEAPEAFVAADIQPLKNLGLNEKEILDLIHSVAIFGWANRLMLNLGEPVFP